MARVLMTVLMFVGLAFMATGCASMTQDQVDVGITALNGAVKALRDAGGVVTVTGVIQPDLAIGLFEGITVRNSSVFMISAVFKPTDEDIE